jgi:DNA-binding transcriptional ArsR family regulator
MTLDDDAESGQSGVEPSLRSELRKVTDAQTMRALAHPVRIALLEELVLTGPSTATVLGERIGESPTTCSFHLRQLAKYGFVEEAGGGKGRARPWRLTSIGISFGNPHDDPAAEVAAGALFRLVRERWLDRYRAWVETKGSYSKAWREAADESEYVFYVTPGELKELNHELLDLLLPKFRDRLTDPAKRPAGSLPVEMLMFSFPVEPMTVSEAESAGSGPGGLGPDDSEPGDSGERDNGGAG